MKASAWVPIGLLVCAAAGTQPSARPARPGLSGAFFAMDTATQDEGHRTVRRQAEMLVELGYGGYGPAYTAELPAMLEVLDELKLPLSALYLVVTFDADGPKYDPAFASHVPLLRGRGTVVWLVVRSEKRAAVSPENDRAAEAVLRELAEVLAAGGVRAAIYPHTGDYIASHRHALRIVQAVGRPNLGVSFNLCHWLRVDGGGDPAPLLRELRPHLFVVSINGADRQDPDFRDWSRFIRPLGEGDFDVLGLLKELVELGFDGAVGLQGYGLKGDVRVHLQRSMRAWREYQERLGRERRP